MQLILVPGGSIEVKRVEAAGSSLPLSPLPQRADPESGTLSTPGSGGSSFCSRWLWYREAELASCGARPDPESCRAASTPPCTSYRRQLRTQTGRRLHRQSFQELPGSSSEIKPKSDIKDKNRGCSLRITPLV
ncbi:hypothetical protein XENOCAPTIV_017902 [Xenoophorus captivus]|uniref:Uncharacterized protein n=1 Tax=Xenoophorus captivus TaxID=1517983 RepID=A0ABV0QTP0_9TELE